MKSRKLLKDVAVRRGSWKEAHIYRVHWFVFFKYLRFADHSKILEKPSHDRCVISFAQIGLGWRRCCNCAMRSCPFLVMIQIMCRLFHVSLAVPCTNVTIQHGLKYAAWMEQDKTKSSCVSTKIRYKTFQIFFFFKRLLCASSIKDNKDGACWAISLNVFWPGCLYDLGPLSVSHPSLVTDMKFFCCFNAVSMLINSPTAIVNL